MLDTAVSAPIPGGARSYDMCWPQPQFRLVGNNTAFQAGPSRQGFLTNTNWVASFGAFGGGTFQTYKGRVCYKSVAAGLGDAETQQTTGAMRYGIFTQKGGAPNKGDFACWRFCLIAATTGAINTAGDFGLEISFNTFADMLTALSQGMMLGPVSATAARFQARQTGGGALTINDVMANDLDTTDYNAYELRFVSATDVAEAFVRVLINGKQRGVYSWGAGTLLPTGAATASCMLTPNMVNRGSSALYIPLGGLRISAGPTEQSLL